MNPDTLRRKIQLANDAYARGVPFLTDYEYDQLWQQLREIDPTNEALYHTAQTEARDGYVTHQVPMLSLQKAFHQDDLRLFWQRFGKEQLLIQPKYDGIALCLYQMREGIRAVLSGDGKGGLDVTRHIPYVKLPEMKSSRLSCEAIILWDDWHDAYGANPRNTVAGLFNRKSLEENNIPITLVPHDSISAPLQHEDLFVVQSLLLEHFDLWSKHYPMDGLVIKVANETLRLQASHNGTFPLWAIAWKPPIQTAETTVTDIEWNISRTGRIIPTICYEPVQLCFTENSRATGNNAAWISDRAIDTGATIIVGKAGEIIPQVVKVKNPGKFSRLPTNCPACDYYLEWDGVHLVCPGPDCVPQLHKKLMYFYSRDGVFLNGVGPSMLETLLQDKIIFEALKRSRWALLEPDTYNITEDIRRVLSPGIFESYMDSLMAVDSELDPARFIGALGYKTLGRKRALVLLQLLKGYKIQHTKHAREALLNMPYAMQDLLRAKKEFQYFCFKSVSPPPEVTYCVTGELSYPREEIIRMLEAYRWQYSATVNKSLTYLVVGELDHETTKLKMAKRFKITLIGEDDLPLGQKGEPDDTTEESNAES